MQADLTDAEALIYVAIRKSDGSMRAMCCDDAGCEEQTAEIIADWVRRGLAVKCLTDAEYRALIAQAKEQGR